MDLTLLSLSIKVFEFSLSLSLSLAVFRSVSGVSDTERTVLNKCAMFLVNTGACII